MVVISAVIMVHYTGPMVGVGELAVSENAAETEGIANGNKPKGNTNTEDAIRDRSNQPAASFSELIQALEKAKSDVVELSSHNRAATAKERKREEKKAEREARKVSGAL